MTNFEKAIGTLQDEYARIATRNKSLQEENELLKSEQYKDEELKKLRDRNTELREVINHYGLNNEDYKKCLDWWSKHLNDKHKVDTRYATKMAPASYKFEIEEFAECTCYSIVCNKCKESFNVYY